MLLLDDDILSMYLFILWVLQ